MEPGSPWENAYSETFISRFSDELLKREVFTNLLEAKVLVEEYRNHYNCERRTAPWATGARRSLGRHANCGQRRRGVYEGARISSHTLIVVGIDNGVRSRTCWRG